MKGFARIPALLVKRCTARSEEITSDLAEETFHLGHFYSYTALHSNPYEMFTFSSLTASGLVGLFSTISYDEVELDIQRSTGG